MDDYIDGDIIKNEDGEPLTFTILNRVPAEIGDYVLDIDTGVRQVIDIQTRFDELNYVYADGTSQCCEYATKIVPEIQEIDIKDQPDHESDYTCPNCSNHVPHIIKSGQFATCSLCNHTHTL